MTACIAHQHIVYLTVKYVNQQRAGMHNDIDNYLDVHLGAHIVTGQFEPDHLWIAPLYIGACEIRVPACAVWVVGR